MNERVLQALSIYLFLVVLLWLYKSPYMFNDEGNIIPFGTGQGKTIFNFPIICIFLAIIVYTIVSMNSRLAKSTALKLYE